MILLKSSGKEAQIHCFKFAIQEAFTNMSNSAVLREFKIRSKA